MQQHDYKKKMQRGKKSLLDLINCIVNKKQETRKQKQ
jgi:hypothetical protein